MSNKLKIMPINGVEAEVKKRPGISFITFTIYIHSDQFLTLKKSNLSKRQVGLQFKIKCSLAPKKSTSMKALISMNYLSKSAKVQIVAPGGTNARLGSAARTA